MVMDFPGAGENAAGAGDPHPENVPEMGERQHGDDQCHKSTDVA